MKKMIFFVASLFLTLLFTSCEEKSWKDGDFTEVSVWEVNSKMGNFFYYPTEGYMIVEVSNTVYDYPISNWNLVDDDAQNVISVTVATDEDCSETHEVVLDKATQKVIITVTGVESGTVAIADATKMEQTTQLKQLK